MKVFWDTSAAINALVSPQVWDRLNTDEHFARLHLFAEFFATMTGRGVPVKGSNGVVSILLTIAALAPLRSFDCHFQAGRRLRTAETSDQVSVVFGALPGGRAEWSREAIALRGHDNGEPDAGDELPSRFSPRREWRTAYSEYFEQRRGFAWRTFPVGKARAFCAGQR